MQGARGLAAAAAAAAANAKWSCLSMPELWQMTLDQLKWLQIKSL